MDTTLSIEQVETIITGYPDSPFFIRQHLVIPNVDWGFLNHEADLLILSKAKYLTEVEIKRSWSDFLADFKKDHKHKDRKLSYFYYAVPISIGEKVFNYLYEGQYSCNPGFIYYNKSKVDGFSDKNYNKCGLIIYADKKESNARGIRIGSCCVNIPAQRIGNYKISDDEEKKLFRLLGLRVWNLKKKLAEMQQRFYLGVDVGEGNDKSSEQIIEV